jgi:hypothetical protein
VSAAIALLDRGWGKPRRVLEMDWPENPVDKMTDEELIELINETGAETAKN